MLPDPDFFVALERRVWQALMEGDRHTDATLLDPEFVGLYDTGFASRDEHVNQLDHGPIIESFTIHESRLLPLASDTVLLAYRATYTPIDQTDTPTLHTEYISSIWKLRGAHWVNVFSQDTTAIDADR